MRRLRGWKNDSVPTSTKAKPPDINIWMPFPLFCRMQRKNDILLCNPAHRVEKVRVEKVYHAVFLRHLSSGTWQASRCWVTQTLPFWNGPTAIRRMSAKRRLPCCLILCWNRQGKTTATLCRTNIPRAMSPGFLFVRHTHSEDFPFLWNPHYWLCLQTSGILPSLHKYRGHSSLGLVIALYRRSWYPLCQTKQRSGQDGKHPKTRTKQLSRGRW